MFSLNDKVVYPGYGVAEIIRIVEKNVAGQLEQFFELEFINKNVTALVPVKNAEGVGLRRLSSQDNIDTILKRLSEPFRPASRGEATACNWNKRNKEYQLKLQTGDIRAISDIYRDLNSIARQKELSFGEKNMLLQTEMLLAEEISAVKDLHEDKAIEYLRALCGNPAHGTGIFRHAM